MEHHLGTTEQRLDQGLSFSALATIAVFFLVTSQIFILPLPSLVTQVFRPLLILSFLIRMQYSGSIRHPARIYAILVAIQAIAVLVFYEERWNLEIALDSGAVALFFLMFSFAIGVNWSRRELRWLILVCFLGCFVCAVALLLSNDPTDFHAATKGHLKLMGTEVNRNKNAYQFSLGAILGLIYLVRGKRIPRLIILAMTLVTGYALLYSQCRGAFLSFMGGATVFFLGLLLDTWKKNGGRAFLLLALLIVAYIAAYRYLQESDLNRLVDEESMSGRDESLMAAWQLFLNGDFFEKIFGHGFGYEATQTGEIGSHTVFVGSLVSMGIIGSGFTALMFLSVLRRLRGTNALALFAVSFLKTLFEGADYNVFIPLILAVTISNYRMISGRRDYDLFSRQT